MKYHIVIERHQRVKGAKVPNTRINANTLEEVDAEIADYYRYACCETMPFKEARVFDTAAFMADPLNTKPIRVVTAEQMQVAA